MNLKKVRPEEDKLSFTAMIDVVFLMIIFFILMPVKAKEPVIENKFPQQGNQPPPFQILPKARYVIQLKAEENLVSSKVRVRVIFSGQELGSLDIFDSTVDDATLHMSPEQMKNYQNQFNPDLSPPINLCMIAIEKAVRGQNKNDFEMILDADPIVPFQAVLAMINATYGAGYKDLKLMQPPT